MSQSNTRATLVTGGPEITESSLARRFFSSQVRGQGLSADMPANTELADIAGCANPEVIAKEGLFGIWKRYECGAFIAALARLQDQSVPE